eukprot:3150551-Amphidinium_carterae.1
MLGDFETYAAGAPHSENLEVRYPVMAADQLAICSILTKSSALRDSAIAQSRLWAYLVEGAWCHEFLGEPILARIKELQATAQAISGNEGCEESLSILGLDAL